MSSSHWKTRRARRFIIPKASARPEIFYGGPARIERRRPGRHPLLRRVTDSVPGRAGGAGAADPADAPDLHRVAALALAAHGFTSAGAVDGGRRLASAIQLIGDVSWAAAAARTGSDAGAAGVVRAGGARGGAPGLASSWRA